MEIQNSKRARALSKQLRCLVCQNQSIDDSDADLAHDLRIEVRRQITAGRSDEIIIDQIRQKYGDYVLFNPPLDRGTVFLWLAPIGFVGLAVLIIVLARRNLHTPLHLNLGPRTALVLRPCWLPVTAMKKKHKND